MSEVKGFKLVYCDCPARFEIHDLNGGMCSYCYEGNCGAETMAFKFLQAAQSELAALREELAIVSREKNDVAHRANETAERLNSMTISKVTMQNKLKQKLASTQQRLTAAEQRNAELVASIVALPDELKELSGCENTAGVYACIDYISNWVAEPAKPTESGASE